MKLVFLYGLPATGKYKVAKELATLTGYRLFHNHLVVDMLLSVFDFGSEPFVALREDIWLSVFEEASAAGLPGMIFTFNPETSVSGSFTNNAVEAIVSAGGSIDFVELTAPHEELLRRIDRPSRHLHGKLVSAQVFEQLHADGVFDTSHMPKPRLSIDTSTCTPAEAAATIVKQLRLPPASSAA
ncbi:MAG: AAA family ATPase [Acidobacteria bacterium]|nr:AAA family ATPase [Acidobacteriota bacterium]